jgi:hypothetical protein
MTMHHHSQSNQPLQGELLNPRQQAESGRALDALTQSLQSGDLLSRFLAPREHREIARMTAERQREAAAEQALVQIRSEATKRIAEIELSGEACRNRLLMEQNKRLAQLKHREQSVVSRDIQQMLVDDQRSQQRLQNTRLLAEDQAMLSELFKQRTVQEMLVTAQTHGVQFTNSPPPTPPEDITSDEHE